MKTRATLSFKLSGSGPRTALSSVLAPDNSDVPPGLTIRERGSERSMIFEVICESPASAISTVLAFLNDVALFQEVWLLSRRPDARVRSVT